MNPFYDYLDNEKTYLSLVEHLYDFFHAEIRRKDRHLEGIIAPYYQTHSLNGTLFMDGNPIFSARNEESGHVIRVVLDEDFPQMTCFNDKEHKHEFVVLGDIKSLDLIKAKMTGWIDGIGLL
ncbi:hypothetical protein [Pectobacterium carotovorum]|uniref:Uncharacterized protein n=1 Tax=Pectobacterium carotovorum TaxID=554 RepID=A0A419B1Z6_PECCA|nr:hypothetical protein [Pectobacterium carotovorum]RJL55756.1 hypothetical protein D5071_00145 [Pectobacterium carotovorum]